MNVLEEFYGLKRVFTPIVIGVGATFVAARIAKLEAEILVIRASLYTLTMKITNKP